MRLPATRPRTAPAADMLPILNIVLLLLAFFLMLARMTPAATSSLPHSATGTAAAAGTVIVVRADGTVVLDGRAVTDAELVAQLRAGDAPLLQLQAEAGVPARRALQLIELAGAADAARVQLLVAGDRR